MTTLSEIKGVVAQEHLFVSGILTSADAALPDGTETLLLLSPDEPAFWSMFRASLEFSDGAPDPMNRWTEAAMTRITGQLDGTHALFPFGGPPWHPFIGWAQASGRAHSSPVGLLAHDTRGLFISYRAALALPYRIAAPDLTAASPCKSCAAPCKTACPVDAFASGSYDVPKCKAHIATAPGRDCMTHGCRVRRACPVGQSLRLPEQSAFHMKAFHPDAA